MSESQPPNRDPNRDRHANRVGRLRERHWPDHSALTAQVNLVVPFQDADPTGMAWHGNYFRYYDVARVALLRQIEFDYERMAQLGQMWPIVDTRVRYVAGIRFGAEVSVRAQLVEWEFRFRIYYEIFDSSGTRLNEAYTVQVPVDAQSQSLIIGVPEFVVDRINRLVTADTIRSS